MGQRPIDVVPACGRLAARQYGLIGRSQARQLGLSKDALYRLVASGAWGRARPGVYSLWIPPAPDALWRHRLMAAALWLGKISAVSHRAGAVLWGLEGIDAVPIELVTKSRRRAREPGLVVHRATSLSPDDIVIRDGLPVTTVPMTILTLAAVATPATLELAVESALRFGRTTLEAIDKALQGSGPNLPGRRSLRSVLKDLPSMRTQSELESRVWQLFRSGGLPLPIRQYEIRDLHGRFVARPDFAYVDELLAIEADGYGSHSNPRDFRRDRVRHNAMTRLGWITYRITWKDVKLRGPAVVAEVAELLRSRAR